MIETEGKFLRQTDKSGYFGRVIIQIIEFENNTIDITDVTGFDDEKVYSDWKKGAEIGANYALSKNLTKKYKVRIKKIIGTDCDTNPTIIGTATILGIWNALNVNVNELEIESLTNLTLDSWNKGFNEMPNYGK